MDDVFVVYDFVVDVEWWFDVFEGLVDGFNCHDDTCAEASWICEEYFHFMAYAPLCGWWFWVCVG